VNWLNRSRTPANRVAPRLLPFMVSLTEDSSGGGPESARCTRMSAVPVNFNDSVMICESFAEDLVGGCGG
jgi:hypothetical protein